MSVLATLGIAVAIIYLQPGEEPQPDLGGREIQCFKDKLARLEECKLHIFSGFAISLLSLFQIRPGTATNTFMSEVSASRTSTSSIQMVRLSESSPSRSSASFQITTTSMPRVRKWLKCDN